MYIHSEKKSSWENKIHIDLVMIINIWKRPVQEKYRLI